MKKASDTVFTDAFGVIQALDKHNGKPIWRTEVGKAIVLSLAADNGVVVTATSNELVGLSGRTGKVTWRQPIRLYGRYTHTPPLIHDGVLYAFSKGFHPILHSPVASNRLLTFRENHAFSVLVAKIFGGAENV